MKLILLPLILLAFSAVITQMMVAEEYYTTANTTYSVDPALANQSIDGTPQTMDIEGYDVTAGFDLQTGVIAVVIVVMAIGVVAGISVLGSGLSDVSVTVIYKSVFFYTLWLLLSVFGLQGITIIPVFGWVFYFFLTLVYSLGVVQQVGGTGD